MHGNPVALHTCLLRSLVVFTLLLVSGCSGLPTRSETAAKTDLESAASVYRPERVRPALPALTSDSDLAQLIEYALFNNPSVESAFYEWSAAVEDVTVARSLPDPMFTLSAEVMSSVVVALTPGLMTDPMGSWPVPAKLSLRAEAAYGETLQKRAAFEAELVATALAVKQAYYQTWVLEQQIRWTREALAIVDEMEQLARENLAVGKATQQDVLRAQMERDRVKNELANWEDSRGPLDARLRSALGMSPQQALPALVLHFEPTPFDLDEASLLETAFQRNPQLKRMRGEVLQAVALYQLAGTSSVPDFAFGLEADVKQSPTAWMPSVGFTLPIWRDRIRAEIASAGAGADAARARLSSEELDLAVRFAETAFGWREADREVKLYGERLLPKAGAALEAARAGYVAGMSDFLDLLEAERTLLDYRTSHAAALGRREQVLAEMSLLILNRWPQGVPGILAEEQSPEAPRQEAPIDESEHIHEHHPNP